MLGLLVRSGMWRKRFSPDYRGLSVAWRLCFGWYWRVWVIEQINKILKVCS